MRLILGVLLFSLSLSCSAQKLRLLAAEYPPYTSQAMPTQGALIEVVQKTLAPRYQLEIVFVPWARALNELKANRADGIIGVWPNSYVDRGFRASSPIFISKLGFYVPTAQRVPLLDLTQLRGRLAGGVRNYGYPTTLYKTGVRIDAAHDDLSNLKKLAIGRISLAILEKAVGEYLLTQPELAPIADKVSWQEPAFAEAALSIAFAPKASAALAAFETALRQLTLSGELKQIANRYQIDLPADSSAAP
ncbi:transporter substrate-binding domain-containing protein [Deefgea piscis]|uniref:Transporter substrate-binding domain-containing protein n=1 Tax=Deefgea piscis TaxID=2739061 RepID=A0A6M8SQB2_9NEIS|nr:transporter substrate-binding domain-containing protein [Deefgea piscis]QKJ66318.1 transporter substrate-binding domain-containing protein [Deefgea piscis]